MHETGPRARTRKLLLETAMQLMQSGRAPSVTDVAEAAEVSRATAYRYFPTQAALVQAAVDEALGPILDWRSTSNDAEQRVEELLGFSYPRIDEYEATLRAALLQAMDQWSAAPGRDARRRGADRPRQPARADRQRIGAAARHDRTARLRPAAPVTVANLRHRGPGGAQGHLGSRRRGGLRGRALVRPRAGARGGRRRRHAGKHGEERQADSEADQTANKINIGNTMRGALVAR